MSASTISVTYVNDPGESWPQAAIDAFEFAKGQWESALSSTEVIRVRARWAKFGCTAPIGVVLGSASPNYVWRDFEGAPQAGTWYPDALADALAGTNLNDNPSDFDIISNFNGDCDDGPAIVQWYFGIDGNTPSGAVDFVSVVLHEIGHGLGFLGAGDVLGSSGTVLFSSYPFGYDRFTEDGSGTPLLSYVDGSTALANALKGHAGGVFFDGPVTTAVNGSSPPALYAPDPFDGGSSYSHLDSSFDSDPINSLMTPTLSTGLAQHILGDITCGVFSDIGWTVDSGACSPALPVELADFTAVADGGGAVLRWSTLSENGSSGFEVQERPMNGIFRTAGFVPSNGESTVRQAYSFRIENLVPGRHEVRLRQIDVDGRATLSDILDVHIPIVGKVVLTGAYPNPFNPATTFSLTVARSQHVRVEVYDALGRFVERLFDGAAETEIPIRLTFDAANVPTGLYVYRAIGEDFSVSGRMIAVK